MEDSDSLPVRLDPAEIQIASGIDKPKHITNWTHPCYSWCRKFSVLFDMHSWYPHKKFIFMHRHSSWKRKTKWLEYGLHKLICFWINLFLEENWSI